MTMMQMLAAAAADAPDAPRTFADGYMTFGALAIIVTVVAGLYAIYRAIRTTRREGEADVTAKITPVAEGLAELAEKVAQHVPRDEIDRGDARVMEVAHDAHRQIGDLREKYGRLDERQQASAGAIAELKQIVTKQGEDTIGRFDRLQDCLIEISRKVGS